MIRPEGWELRLTAEIEAARLRPWAWGSHDCVTFAHACARAMAAGATPWDALVGRWTTALGARRALATVGAQDVAQAMDLHAERVPLALAGRGDVVAVRVAQDGTPDFGGEPALGVCEGARAWFAAAPAGVTRIPMADAFAAWRV